MMWHIPKKDLGRADYGWLQAHYHFSFANYYNPKRMGVGALRVINDDVIAPHSGFDMHPHKDMEIISYVKEGAITHRDSEGHQGKTKAGEVQVITAGSGIYHSEHNEESIATHMFQIWIRPEKNNLSPRWEKASYKADDSKALQLLVSGDGDAPLHINQKAKMYLATLEKRQELHLELDTYAYLVMLKGAIKLDNIVTKEGDGVGFQEHPQLALQAEQPSEFLLLSLRSE